MHQRNNIYHPQRDLARNSRLATLNYFIHDSDHKFKPTEFRLLKRQKHLFSGFVTVYQCLFIATQKLYIIRDVFKAVNMSHRHEINCKINLADVKLSIWITSLPRVLYFDISSIFISRIAFFVIFKEIQSFDI